jgi:hypothetical protein
MARWVCLQSTGPLSWKLEKLLNLSQGGIVQGAASCCSACSISGEQRYFTWLRTTYKDG